MPFENTHLYLADKVRQACQDDELSGILEEQLDYFYMGSIFPDTLFYAKEDKLSRVAYRLHGDDGRPTSRFAFEVLERIRETKSRRDFAFVAGFLTHCAADITFHPLVFYISGFMPDASQPAKQKSSYLHWKYETLIDLRLNDRFRFEEVVRPHLVEGLVAPDVLGVAAGTVIRHMKKQRQYLGKIRSRFHFHVFRVLSRVGLVPPESVAGFYESLKTGDIDLPEHIAYRDVLTGEAKEASLEMLAEQSVTLGARLVAAAHGYFKGAISRAACETTIRGESLHTGRLGKTLKDVRHAADVSALKS
jgi:hypothetical protein